MNYDQAFKTLKDLQTAHVQAGAAVFGITDGTSTEEREMIKQRLHAANRALRDYENWFFANHGTEYWDAKRR